MYEKYTQDARPEWLKALNEQLSSNSLSTSGPYVIGNTVTYADLVAYQIMHDEGLTKNGRAGLQNYSRLIQLVDAIEERPNVKAFLASDRYRG